LDGGGATATTRALWTGLKLLPVTVVPELFAGSPASGRVDRD